MNNNYLGKVFSFFMMHASGAAYEKTMLEGLVLVFKSHSGFKNITHVMLLSFL